MLRTQFLAVLLCLVVNFIASHGQGIIRGPANDAVFATSPVTFQCIATPGDRVFWKEYVTNPNGIVISDGDQLIPDHPNRARYDLVADVDAGTYDLTITETIFEDGGLYECLDENTGTKLRAQLVIIAAPANCSSTLPPDGVVVEGIQYTIECNVYYRASSGVLPTLTWTGPGFFNQISVNQTDTVVSGVGFAIQRSMDTKFFTLTTYFRQEEFGGVDTADNVPTFKSLYYSTTIFVRYAPQNVSYTPVKQSYEIGDVLTCNSDAVPTPTYVWTDLLTNIEYPTQDFTITAEMVGAALFRCRVENVVGSFNVFVNSTVNPITTPTTPTTTPTTTTVPAVANCPDITGRWEYVRAADSKAVLCMYVDRTQNGYINGLFWNDTKTETYYMDIVGRTRNNIYDETGLVGIWPLNIGVSSFAIECQRCFGEETLLLNAVSRSSQDDEFCGDGGTILTGVQYALKRVPWSYPCGPVTTTNELRAVSKQAALRRKKRLAANRRF